jgi:hypothetical protein
MRIVLALVSLAAAAGLAQAQAYTIKVKPNPDQGQAVRHSETTRQATTLKVTDEDGKVVQDRKEKSDKTDVHVETIVTAGDRGRASKFTRKYEKAAASTDGKARAENYEGETLVFELNKDGKYVAKAEGKKELSKEDADKLEDGVNRDGRVANPMAELMPGKPVKVGETWEIGGKQLASCLGRKGVDMEKSKGKGKLIRAYKKGDQQWGTVEITADLAMTLSGVPTKGDYAMTLDVAIDGSSSAGKAKVKVTITQDREAEKDNKKYKVAARTEITGEIDRVDVK